MADNCGGGRVHLDVRDRYREVAVRAAHVAGQLLRQYFGTPQSVEHKGERDLVTALDRRAEALIVACIREAFPEHAILAEEGTRGGPDAEHCWLIDPLDGTTNYAHGYPTFAVSIGYERAGRLDLGVVYDPLREELFLAEAGRGATVNGRLLHVSSTAELRLSLLATGFPYDRALLAPSLRRWETLIQRGQAVRRNGSAALDLCYVAAGRLDGYCERPVQPWDVAAGVLLVAEAGGTVTDLRGRPAAVRGAEAVATNGHIHAELLAALAAGDG